MKFASFFIVAAAVASASVAFASTTAQELDEELPIVVEPAGFGEGNNMHYRGSNARDLERASRALHDGMMMGMMSGTNGMGKGGSGLGGKKTQAPTMAPTELSNDYFNGFEDPNDVDAANPEAFYGVFRAVSDPEDIVSAEGEGHALLPIQPTGVTPFTRYSGFNSVDVPFKASVQVYLDPDTMCTGQDKSFEFTHAISRPDGTQLRDFIFHAGCDSTASFTDAMAFSASHNTNFAIGAGKQNSITPIPYIEAPLTGVMQIGWYTLEHSFTVEGDGSLTCGMSVIAPDGTILKTFTLNPISDVMGTFQGNRYGWFTRNQFALLPIDNVQLVAQA